MSLANPSFPLGVLIDIEIDPSAGEWPEHTYAHLAHDANHIPDRVALLPIQRIDIRTNEAVAWWYRRDASGWQRSLTPLPPVLYNRIGRRKIEASRAGRRLLRRLATSRPLFNPGFLDKLGVYRALERHGLADAMPAFIQLESPEAAVSFYCKHQEVFVKPSTGSLGRGVARLSRVGPNENRLSENTAAGLVRRRLRDSELQTLFRRYRQSSDYVVQAGVALARRSGRSVDLRALMQKDQDGRWRLTGAAGRAAVAGVHTTHTVHGGARIPLDSLSLSGEPFASAIGRLEEFLQRASLALETQLRSSYFELSYDVGVDGSGSLFILEANAKPFPFDEEEIRSAAAARLMAFAEAVRRTPQLLRPPP